MSDNLTQPAGADIARIDDPSLTAFYNDMTVPERRTFWACAAGWCLDGMDFMIYPLVIGTLMKATMAYTAPKRARRSGSSIPWRSIR